MKLIKIIGFAAVVFNLFACENEVEINADFEEETFVLGLLDPESDTQFVRITKSFLDNNTSAIQLAQDPNNLYHDSLIVTINELTEEGGEIVQTFELSKISRPKDQGLFTTEDNLAYFTTSPIKENTDYSLQVDKLDNGALTTGETRTTEGVRLTKPNIRTNGKLTLVNIRKQISDFDLKFEPSDNIGEYSINIIFNYMEIINVDSVIKSFEIPVTLIKNPSLSTVESPYTFEGQKFFDAFLENIPASVNPPKRLFIDKGVHIEIQAADADYTLYRDVNGPIDGLAQTRPEYPNITNGIGLFASRNTQINKVDLNGDTKNYIYDNYGDRDNLSEFRGFEQP